MSGRMVDAWPGTWQPLSFFILGLGRDGAGTGLETCTALRPLAPKASASAVPQPRVASVYQFLPLVCSRLNLKCFTHPHHIFHSDRISFLATNAAVAFLATSSWYCNMRSHPQFVEVRPVKQVRRVLRPSASFACSNVSVL